jgi:hypothetical protein
MKEIIHWHATEFLIAIVVLVCIVGIGHLIILDMGKTERAYNTCIGAGKQYVFGSCVN